MTGFGTSISVALQLGRLDERNIRIEDAYGRLCRHR